MSENIAGSFAKLFGAGADQVLVQVAASPLTGSPCVLFTFNPQVEGYHTVSFVHEQKLMNENDQTAVWEQVEGFFASITEEFAVNAANMHRAYMQKQAAGQPFLLIQ